MKYKFAKRVIALAMSLALLGSLVPITASASTLASWQDVYDTGLFAVNSAWQGEPVLTATDAGLVVSNRAQTGNEGEHHGFAFNLSGLRAAGSGDSTVIVFTGNVQGEADRMFTQAFDGNRGRGDDDWPRGYIDDDGNFSVTIGPNELHGVPTWAAWAEMPWIGAHPRGDLTITEITLDGVSIREMDLQEVGIEIIDFDFPEGVLYSLLHDPFIQGLSQGDVTEFADVATFAAPGTASRIVTANPHGGNAIRVTERETDYASIDLLWRTLHLEDGRYAIEVIGNIELEDEFDPAEFVLAGTVNPWGWIGEASLEFVTDYYTGETIGSEINVVTGDFSMIREFSVIGGEIVDDENGAIGGNIRLFTAGFTNNFTIHQIAIVTAGQALPPAVTTGPGEIALRIGSTVAMAEGALLTLEVAPYIERNPDRTMVPLRFVADALGADNLDWDAATQTVSIDFGGETITIVAGQPLPDEMGMAVIRDGRTFVPVRFVATEMGASVTWEASTQIVTITLG
ncbi:MAG: copper amine oxidase N-terminal domain-containing protein [Defluviitaleaceae bacterium]|nr:copper amine oxidase N-terminal domain-containing protein [Defluviitaleaceae bacterium]